MKEVFLDTSFAIALSVVTDRSHRRAVEPARQLRSERTTLITTQAILLEIGNALSRLRYRQAAVQLLDALQRDPRVKCVSLTDDLFDQAFELFQNRLDKEWGLIDCVSFVVMKQQGLSSALTTDEHFEQAGFQALLRDP